ncbi:MAG: SDR family oxidoreductase, partial [Clostridia bacterium]|nr:SDR family oxidoreductase [Clostridia bacterium]
AELAAFLLSPASRLVNGAGIRADGGLVLHYMDAAANLREYRKREAEHSWSGDGDGSFADTTAAIFGKPDHRTVGGSRLMPLAGRNILVTGSGKGIGSDIVKTAASMGARVVVHYNSSEESALRVRDEILASGAPCALIKEDLSADGGAARLYEKATDAFAEMASQAVAAGPASSPEEAGSAAGFGDAGGIPPHAGIDILVNNAALQMNFTFDRYNAALLKRILKVNLKGYTMLSRLALPYMCSSGWGRIINISSVHSKRPTTFDPGYCMTKGGIRMLTRELALEMTAYPDITVNAVEPGAVEIGAKSGNPPSTVPDAQLRLPRLFPYRKLANGLLDPSEISSAVMFLASDAAGRINGSCLRVDDGAMLK